jgi:TPR repeat protein
MDKPFFRRMFSRSQVPAADITETPASLDTADAQFSRGLSFACEGAAQDYAQALLWYRKAADQSHSLAQFNLALMYAAGQGVPRDAAQSKVWMQRSADLGDAGAQYNVGMNLHRASLGGLPGTAAESRIQAYKWLRLSAAQGYRGSDAASAFVALSMTREDVTEGVRRVAAFVPTQVLQA